MEKLRTVLGGGLVFGLLAMIPVGCGNSDSSPVQPNVPTNRIYVMKIGTGVLTPAFESAGEETVLDANQDWEYILTLENVGEDVPWYTNRPERKTGETTIQAYVDLWTGIYGEVSPNAFLDGYLNERIHDGLYLNLREPLYDSQTNSLTFQVTLLGSTMDNPHPVEPVDISGIRITVVDNTPAGEATYWSFGQAARESKLEATGTEGLYKLSLIGAYPEVLQFQNAPGTRSAIMDQESLEYNWQAYFSTAVPNASLTGHSLTNPGKMKLALMVLDNPSHDGTNIYYDAKLLGGENLQGDSLTDVVLLIDGYSAALGGFTLFECSPCDPPKYGTGGCTTTFKFGTCNPNCSTYFASIDDGIKMTAGSDCRTVNSNSNDKCTFTLGDNGVTQIDFDYTVTDECHATVNTTEWLAFWMFSNNPKWTPQVEVDLIESYYGPNSGGLNSNFDNNGHQVGIFRNEETNWHGHITAKFWGTGDAVNVSVSNDHNSQVATSTLQRESGYFFVMDTALGSGNTDCSFTVSNLQMKGNVPSGQCVGVMQNTN